jgi:hypothetical protein
MGLLCIGKDDTKLTPGTCKSTADAFSVATAGASCDYRTALCATGLSCALDAVTPAIAFKCVQTGGYAAGAACKPAIPEACAAGNYCKTAQGDPLNGTCTPQPLANEACGTNAIGKACGPNLVCVVDRCVAKAQNGVSCAASGMCYSGKCTKVADAGLGSCEEDVPCK